MAADADYIPWDEACSFTCPLTCDGPGDPDHESQAERTARLARAATERARCRGGRGCELVHFGRHNSAVER